MTPRTPNLPLVLCAVFVSFTGHASAQAIESVGSRALGMGGAFVAVASDSSATWWNPGGLAAGPFVDIAVAHATTDLRDTPDARRDGASWFALATPPVGVSYYRLRLTNVRTFETVSGVPASGQASGRMAQTRSWSGGQLGVTVVQTLLDGVHVGTTFKYVRGTARTDSAIAAGSPAVRLDRGDELTGGQAEGKVDLDLGLLATAGAMRIGAVVRNLRQTEFGDGQFTLSRQVRVGAAFNAEEADGPPFIVALDADVRSYESASGDRRVVAIGAERWFSARRVGVRGGGRVNTVGAHERSATAGVSLAVRSGLYVEGHIVHGGATDDRGWGAAARVSF